MIRRVSDFFDRVGFFTISGQTFHLASGTGPEAKMMRDRIMAIQSRVMIQRATDSMDGGKEYLGYSTLFDATDEKGIVPSYEFEVMELEDGGFEVKAMRGKKCRFCGCTP